jgi:hypothetical protein
MTVRLWRIVADTPLWTVEDMAGKGAAQKGAPWNHAGEHVTYAAASISLAAWETRAHFGKGARLPWNRYCPLGKAPRVAEGAMADRVARRPLVGCREALRFGGRSRDLGSSALRDAVFTPTNEWRLHAWLLRSEHSRSGAGSKGRQLADRG